MEATGQRGPLGETRSIPLSILWAILTLGIYAFVWVYRTQEEIKRYSGNGIGGVIGLVIFLVIGVVTYFVVPSEVRYMYEDLDGGGKGSSPVRGDHRPLGAAAHRGALHLVLQGAGRAEPLLGVEGRPARVARFPRMA